MTQKEQIKKLKQENLELKSKLMLKELEQNITPRQKIDIIMDYFDYCVTDASSGKDEDSIITLFCYLRFLEENYGKED